MSPSRSFMSTLAPCAASSSAVARPMPLAEPVTIADFPSSTPMALASPFDWKCRGARLGGLRPLAPPSWLQRPQVIGSEVVAGGAARYQHSEVLGVDRAR